MRPRFASRKTYSYDIKASRFSPSSVLLRPREAYRNHIVVKSRLPHNLKTSTINKAVDNAKGSILQKSLALWYYKSAEKGGWFPCEPDVAALLERHFLNHGNYVGSSGYVSHEMLGGGVKPVKRVIIKQE